MNMTFVAMLVQRLKSQQPVFFKKMQTISLYVAVVVGIVWGVLHLNVLPISADVVSKLSTACYAIGTFLGGVFFTAQTGTKDPNLVSDDTKQNIVAADKISNQ